MSTKIPKHHPNKKNPPPPVKPENFPKELERSQDQHRFRWDNPHSYSAALGIGYGKTNFHNGKGLDHQGLLLRLAAGFRIPLGKWRDHIVLPRLFYEYQGNHIRFGKDLLLSRSQAHRFGIEANYLYEALPTWLQIGASLELGLAAYRTPKGELSGAQFNGNGAFRPLRDTGSHLEAGILLCTFNALACVQTSYGADLGLKAGMEGLNPHGVSVGLQIDAMRFFHYPTPKAVRKKYRGDTRNKKART